ncbi:hypothetical protein CAT42_14580, partial [Acinetobacter baumannii]
FVCRLLHLKIISLKNPLQIGLCNKAVTVMNLNVRKHCARNNRFHIKKTNKKGRLRLTFLFL